MNARRQSDIQHVEARFGVPTVKTTQSGQLHRELARLLAGSPSLPQVEAWGREEYDRMDPGRVLDRDGYVHAFIECHELLEDVRAERIYLEQRPEHTSSLGLLAQSEIAHYEGENPVGAYAIAIGRPYVPENVREPLRRAYIALLGKDEFENLESIFDSYLNPEFSMTESERRSLVHRLVFQERPSVFGMTFADGSDFDWRFRRALNLHVEGHRDFLGRLIEASVLRFKTAGTLQSGDVMLIRTAPEPWGSSGFGLYASPRPGRVHMSIDRFLLTEQQTTALVNVGWQSLGGSGPEVLLVKEVWVRQAHELSQEILWAWDFVLTPEFSNQVLHVFGAAVVLAASLQMGDGAALQSLMRPPSDGSNPSV